MFGQTRNIDTYTDEELVKQIVDNKNSHYFSILYDRYAGLVYNKCYTFADSEEEAQDLTHDIFIKIFINLKTFKGESKLSTWIYSVTYHFCISYINKKKSSKVSFSDEILNGAIEKDLLDEESDKELFEIKYTRLQEILKLLQIDEKMILLMKYQDDLSIKDIAGMLNLNESTVKMRLHRAKKKVLELSER